MLDVESQSSVRPISCLNSWHPRLYDDDDASDILSSFHVQSTIPILHHIMSDPIELRPMGASAPPPPPRHPDTPSGGLGQAYRSAEDKARAAVHLQEGGLDNVSIWGCGLASW